MQSNKKQSIAKIGCFLAYGGIRLTEKSEKKSNSDKYNRQISHAMRFREIVCRMKLRRHQSAQDTETEIAKQCSDRIGDQVIDIGCPVRGKELNDFNKERQSATDKKCMFYGSIIPAEQRT